MLNVAAGQTQIFPSMGTKGLVLALALFGVAAGFSAVGPVALRSSNSAFLSKGGALTRIPPPRTVKNVVFDTTMVIY